MSRGALLGRADRGPDRRRLRDDRELLAFLSPLTRLLGRIWQRMHLVILASVVLYASSGISIIEADEVGIVLRFGAITRSTDGPVIHPPGMLLAYPRPFDEVLKVKVERIETIVLDELALSPEVADYALTGDRNIVHAQLVARYRVSDPIEYLLLASDATDFLRSALRESITKLLGAKRLDDLLGGGREQFARSVVRSAQGRLDKIGVGVEIVSMELEHLSPPRAVAADFDSVQSAYIEAQTVARDANAYAAQVVPAAKAQAHEVIGRARATSLAVISAARADTSAFAALLPSYRTAPALVRQRLYREGLERALGGVGELKLVPPPGTGGYGGTRFLLSLPAGSSPTVSAATSIARHVGPAEVSGAPSTAAEKSTTEGLER